MAFTELMGKLEKQYNDAEGKKKALEFKEAELAKVQQDYEIHITALRKEYSDSLVKIEELRKEVNDLIGSLGLAQNPRIRKAS